MKRKAPAKLENQIVKKQKVASEPENEAEKADNFYSSSEEFSSDLSSVELISDVLKPHEVLLLTEDPWNINIYHSSWTNEYTIAKDETKADRAKSVTFSTATSTTLPNDFFWHILLNSDLQNLMQWRLVSKYFDTLLSTSPKLWQSLFYRQRWRLPHEIRNFNESDDPSYSEIVIDERKVDWFSECKRNYLNAKRIQSLIDEISQIMPQVIKPYAKRRKSGGSMKRARMFNAGLTDNELDAWEERYEFKLTNDFRALYKCMNGARFKFVPKIDEEIWDYECARPPPVCFPKLDTVRVVPVKWTDFKLFDEETVQNADKTQLVTSAFKDQPSQGLKFTQEELDSDGSSYSMSSEEESDTDQSMLTVDHSAHLRVLYLGQHCVDEDNEYLEDMIYEPVIGAIMPLDTWVWRRTSPALSIVEYLQQLCDMLERDTRVPLLFTFTDYIVKAPALHKELTDSISKLEDPSIFKGTLRHWLAECREAFLWMHDCVDYIPARAIRLIKAAAEDFVVKVFARAQTLETSDVLQADTFITAAKELGKEYFPNPEFPFERATLDPKSRLHRLLNYWIILEDGKTERLTKPLNTNIIDL